ncbi:MAG: hypothetical protein QOK08_2138, partial [Actinomycetota bacterium]|nr:hypothetical protein [Actinomycetota bacterium]
MDPPGEMSLSWGSQLALFHLGFLGGQEFGDRIRG